MMVPVCNLVTLNYVNALNHHNIYQKGLHDEFQPNPPRATLGELFKTTSSFFRMTILMFILPSEQKPILEVPSRLYIYIYGYISRCICLNHVQYHMGICLNHVKKKTHPPLSPSVYHIFTSHVFVPSAPLPKKTSPVFSLTALVGQHRPRGTLHGGFLCGTDAGAGVVVLLVGLFLTLRVSNLLPERA